MALRGARLGVRRRNFTGLGEERVRHGGSETVKSAPTPVRRFIQEAHRRAQCYRERRWGAMPPAGESMPARRHPFDNPALHGADWTLDLAAREELARECEALTGFACPVVYHRAVGGLG